MDFEDNNPFSAIDAVSESDMSLLEPKRESKVLKSLENQKITITDAGKSREGTKRGHITYTINVGGVSVRRRYSEFESLCLNLRRMLPTIVVPPIPEKHSLSAYATNPSHAHEDARIIEHRRRMLSVFLKRCLETPVIRDSYLMERFLDPNTSWNEVLTSEYLANLPKSPLQAPPLDAANPTPAHAYLPIPPAGARLRNETDPLFKNAEASAKEYETVIGNGLDKAARRVNAQYGSFARDCADLGGQFNAFSLESQGNLAVAVEKVGQALDTGYLSTDLALKDSLTIDFSEPLAESVQLAATARQVLKYRRYRAIQVEMVEKAMAAKRASLHELEHAEVEAQKINDFLHADERINNALSGSSLGHVTSEDMSLAIAEASSTEHSTPTCSDDGLSSKDGSTRGSSDCASIESVDKVEPVQPQAETRSSGSRGFRLPGLSSINSALQGMMDTDPETTRRNNITRNREQLANLEGALEIAKEDSTVTSEAVKNELERYKKVKDQDLTQLIRAFVRCHIEWAEKNLAAWEEAHAVVTGDQSS